MARTAIAVQSRSKNSNAAVSLGAVDNVNGMSFPNDGQTRLVVKNGSGSPVTVTVRSVACSHGRTGDDVATVAAGAIQHLGPYSAELFSQSGGVGGSTNVDFSAGTSITIGALSEK